MTGFSDVIGSWKTIAISGPRGRASAAGDEPDDVVALEPDRGPAGRRRALGAGP